MNIGRGSVAGSGCMSRSVRMPLRRVSATPETLKCPRRMRMPNRQRAAGSERKQSHAS